MNFPKIDLKDKKTQVALAVALIALTYVGYWWYTKDDKTTITPTTTTNTTTTTTVTDPYEGKNVTAGVDGVYGGGVIYLIKGGKRSVYGNDSYKVSSGLNWNDYIRKNGDDAIVIPQSVIDKYKDLNAN